MKRTTIAAALLTSLCVVSLASAQDAASFPAPQKEHEWLKQFEGDWIIDNEASMGPDQPTMKCKGAMASRVLGGFWVVSDWKMDTPGMQMTAIQTIGYDPSKKAYVGSWVDSATSHMWRYEGSVDESGKKLTLEAEGPNFLTPGKTARFRDAYEFKSKDHIVATSSMQGEDGKWITFMTGKAQRKK